ncbi:DNA methyltransferase [Acinetobacter corruptisaponis]|uniref:site-specific DNA-methyltransferase (adenine-specific) n=1 Tax=Acinetobacter corruptisaponis TaxID=3045147 RepID=A0ABY8S771_9GAMM|nr:site-specific DNA-methyltransferase [Acinetobacter sp. KCTC 92772]WHP07545.1 DNA methyltransferase [Acinetobacter sp. KCTC 92772]
MSGIKNNLQHNATAQANTAFLKELQAKLPQYFTAEKTETIKLKDDQTETQVIQTSEFNIEKFLADLAQNNIHESRDGYRLSFVGKDYARLQTGLASETVIVPDIEHNQKPENQNSQNVFITGDNLEALRHLQNAYTGDNAIKMIYIDPPYNTGKEFVYNDKFDFTDEKLKNQLGYSDEEIARLKSIQGKSSHSAWLTFMYPRLKIAQKLLREDGVIFVSIDDNEQANLKLLMDDVFGENNYLSTISRLTGTPTGNGNATFVNELDYILVYSKNSIYFQANGLPLTKEQTQIYNQEDKNGKYLIRSLRRTGGEDRREDRPSMYYGVESPDGNLIFPIGPTGYESRWVVGKSTYEQMKENHLIEWKQVSGQWQIYQKFYLENRVQQPSNLWKDNVGNKRATRETRKLFDEEKLFDFPKPVDLIKQILTIASHHNSIILDFFAGSSTTADAVMQLNAEDGGNRKYIMVQWDEQTSPDSAARQAGYQTIDQISRERIKRAAAKIRSEKTDLPEQLDLGFKHYRLATPQIKTLEQIENFDPNQQDLFAHDMLEPFSATILQVDGLATGIDTLLQTWLMNDGYPFNTPIEILNFAGYQAFYLKEAQSLYLLAPDFKADCLKVLLNQMGQNQLLVNNIILYPYSFSFEELHQLKTNLKTNLEHTPKIIERF